MPARKSTIKIKVKLFTGLAEDAKVKGYDPVKGLAVDVPEGTRLKGVIKMLGFSDSRSLIFFMNGERVGSWKRLQEGDELNCFRPVAGG